MATSLHSHRILVTGASGFVGSWLAESLVEQGAFVVSAEKARRLLGWAPWDSLEEGLRETVAWYRQYLADRSAVAPVLQEAAATPL